MPAVKQETHRWSSRGHSVCLPALNARPPRSEQKLILEWQHATRARVQWGSIHPLHPTRKDRCGDTPVHRLDLISISSISLSNLPIECVTPNVSHPRAENVCLSCFHSRPFPVISRAGKSRVRELRNYERLLTFVYATTLSADDCSSYSFIAFNTSPRERRAPF